MTATINQTEVLNDLIAINNDRVEGYNKAVNEVDPSDVDLKVFFGKMSTQSRENVAELEKVITDAGGEVEHGTTISGKVYRVWMDIKSTIMGNHKKSALDLCEYGEDAAQHAYDKALESADDLDVETVTLLKKQQYELKESHDTIKKFRDIEAAKTA
jgi:uncharacterized protein (TIGR02284 family)